MNRLIKRWKKDVNNFVNKSSRYEEKSFNHTRFKYQAIAIRNCYRQLEGRISKKWKFDYWSFIIGAVAVTIIKLLI